MENDKDAENQPLTPKSDDADQFQFVYCVNHGYLPSHIRKVVLITDKMYQEKDKIEVIKHGNGPHKRCKCIVIIVIVVLLFLVSSVIALSVWRYFDSTTEQDHVTQLLGLHNKQENSSTTSNNIIQHSENTNRKDPSVQSRPRCNKVCYSYSAFRFNSKCVDGYCVCRSQGYHHLTCLPKVNGCTIKKTFNKFVISKYKDQKQRTFSCVTDKETSEEIHVISSFGNNYVNTTIVDVVDSRINFNRPVVLVLSNYQKVKWTINIKDKINLKTIYLVSNKNLRNSEVILNNKNPDLKTNIVRTYSQMGYGDDRNGGHTVDLLQKIAKDIGHITTFTGTSRADKWLILLKNSYSLVT